MGEDGAQLTGPGLAGQDLDQLLSEAPADHTVEQEVGGGVEVLQHVGDVPGHVDGDGVVVPVEGLSVVHRPKDAVRDKARQAEHDKRHGDGAQQQNSSPQHAPGAPAVNGPSFFLGEEVSGATQVVSHQVVEDDDQNNRHSARKEGGYPHYGSGVDLIAVAAPWHSHILPVHRDDGGCDHIDPTQGH